MGKHNPYGHRAVKATVYGHTKVGLNEDGFVYDSQLEAKMARVLLKHRVRFTPHVKFALVRPDGTSFDYTVDFLTCEPLPLLTQDGDISYVRAIEIKGRLCKKDFLRMKALTYSTQYKGIIAGDMLIDFWDKNGLT